MKAEIHPNYKEVTVICSCGHKFKKRYAAPAKKAAKPDAHA